MTACTMQVTLYTGATGTVPFTIDQSITALPNPVAPACTGNTGTGSSFTAGQTCNVAVTYIDAAGETQVSPNTLVTIGSTANNIVVTLPSFPVPEVTGMSVYVSTANGGATLNRVAGGSPTSAVSGGTVTVTNFSSTGTVVPASNTAAVTPSTLLFNQTDDNTTTTNPIVVPTAAGTAYSFCKEIGFQVINAGTTNITALGYALAQTLTTGFYLFYNTTGSASYTQSVIGNQPAINVSSNGAVPASFTAMTASTVNYWTGSVSTATNGVKGNYTQVVFGVGNNYAGAGGTGVNLVSSGNAINAVYDEQ